MANNGYTDEELQGLTEEERQAIEDDTEDVPEVDDDPDPTATAEQEAAGEDEGQGDDDGAKAESEEGGESEGDGEGAGDGEPENEAAGEEGEQDQPKDRQKPHVPLLDADLPEDVEQQAKQIQTDKGNLIQKFDDGELTGREYQEELDKLNRQEREIERAHFRSEIAQEMEERRQKQEWANTVDSFLEQHPEYQERKLLYKTLDTAVREIAADEQNASLSGKEILQKAHDQIQEEFGLGRQSPDEQGSGEGESDGKDQGKKPDADKGGKKKEAEKPEIPPTLGKVPAADTTETENSKWGWLDRLSNKDPERFEAELAKLPDDEREAYLAAE